jgi:hypothetical protein
VACAAVKPPKAYSVPKGRRQIEGARREAG